jgi:hypothetical protein
MNLNIIKIPHRKVRTFTFITSDGEKEADEQIELLKKTQEIKNIVPNSKIVDISKIKLKDIYGIKITTLNIDYILSNYNVYLGENIIHLVNSVGENADKCFLTNEKIPYEFRLF